MSFSSLPPDSIEENSENELDLSEEHTVLTNLIANLSIDDSNNINSIHSNMARANFDNKLLEIVPKFDGNPLELSSFLETANSLYNTYYDPTPANRNSVQNITILYGLYSKLIGKAREVYSICISKEWVDIKNALIAHFGDQRDENGLLFDLDQLRQNNEPSLQFYTRIMSNLSALHNYIDVHENDANIIAIKKQFYQTHALKIFLAGLKEPLGSTIRAMRPDSLATARQYIISENNIRHLQKPNENRMLDSQKNKQAPKFYHNNPNNNHNQKFFPQNFQHNFFQQPTNYQNPFPQPFPRGPVNIQPRPVPPQRFLTNRQVFGPPKNPTNVFKPNPHRQALLPKPTPMSGISHGTFQRSMNSQPRPFRPPQFTFEELYNLEEPYNEYNTPHSSYDNNYEYYYPNYDLYNYTDYTNTECETEDNYLDENIEQPCEQNTNQNFQETQPRDEIK